MLGHTRKHHINAPSSIIQPTIPKRETTPWRETAEEDFAKYTEAGQMLRGARFKAELTQKQLAEKLGVKQHHICEMEHGKRVIGKEMAKRLSEVLDINYKVFL